MHQGVLWLESGVRQRTLADERTPRGWKPLPLIVKHHGIY